MILRRRHANYGELTSLINTSVCRAGTGRHLSGNGQRTAYARFAHQDSGRIASVPGGLYRITVSGSDPFNRNVKLSIPAGRKNCCISQTGTIPPGYSRAPSSFSTSTIENVWILVLRRRFSPRVYNTMFQKSACAGIIKEIADYALKSDAAMVRCGSSCLCW